MVNHIWVTIYSLSYSFSPNVCRGYTAHAEPETDSDGDGGTAGKLRGRGHIEFSTKGIPHGILHFPLQLRLAGHIYMHDTCAPEAAHRFNVKTAMDRVRKSAELETSKSLIDWNFRVRTWAKIIDSVQENDVTVARKIRVPSSTEVRLTVKNRIDTFSPLRDGGDNLLCNDARISHIELGTLISRFTGWDLDVVLDDVQVRLYCSARVLHSSGERRTYWATESCYHYSGGSRRDMVEIDLGGGNIGVGQITSFLNMSTTAIAGVNETRKCVLIRWMSKSTLSTHTDDYDRPLCDFPLSFNHCLWQWSDAGRNRACFSVRGFRNRSLRCGLWKHIHQDDRQRAIDSETKARYDIIGFDSIKRHANIHKDPSTGHMLQTLQIV